MRWHGGFCPSVEGEVKGRDLEGDTRAVRTDCLSPTATSTVTLQVLIWYYKEVGSSSVDYKVECTPRPQAVVRHQWVSIV